MYFYGNETNNCVIESIFSGNDQQKVYSQSYRVIMQTCTCPEAYNGGEMERIAPNMCRIRRNVSEL